MLSPFLFDLSLCRGAIALMRAFEIPALALQFLLAIALSLILFHLPPFQGFQLSFRSFNRLPRWARPGLRFRLRW